ncbi:MAG TPA: precorrin-2 C(20)-methyltransferase [Fibrobacteraceae bacterium]|nr:precorrin-2 C(20)-methyltransferase [Fibrobacteraceae bacterium]
MPKSGILYGVGVGPGNPDWITLQAAKILGQCYHVVAPRASIKQESLALEIARPHLRADVLIHDQVYPMSRDPQVLRQAWNQAAQEIRPLLESGEDVAFITIGDALLYSTFIYLQRALQCEAPHIRSQAIPGIPAFIAAASLTNTPLGEGQQPLVLVPVTGDSQQLDWALQGQGTVVLMKAGERWPEARATLESHQALQRGTLYQHVGQKKQRIEPLAHFLDTETSHRAYLSLAIIPPEQKS